MKAKQEVKPLTDKTLIARAKKDGREFEALYRKYADEVFNYLWYRLNYNREAAEDLTQETFVRAFEHLPKFQQRGYSYKTYLLAIAKNLWINYLKQQKVKFSLDELTEVPAEALQAEKVDKKIAAEKLWRAVQQLPHQEKDAILMRYREEMKIKEMAKIMAKTPNAVKIILSRARKKLKQEPSLRHIACLADIQRKYVRPRFLKKIS